MSVHHASQYEDLVRYIEGLEPTARHLIVEGTKCSGKSSLVESLSSTFGFVKYSTFHSANLNRRNYDWRGVGFNIGDAWFYVYEAFVQAMNSGVIKGVVYDRSYISTLVHNSFDDLTLPQVSCRFGQFLECLVSGGGVLIFSCPDREELRNRIIQRVPMSLGGLVDREVDRLAEIQEKFDAILSKVLVDLHCGKGSEERLIYYNG